MVEFVGIDVSKNATGFARVTMDGREPRVVKCRTFAAPKWAVKESFRWYHTLASSVAMNVRSGDVVCVEAYAFHQNNTRVVEVGAIVRYELYRAGHAWHDVAPSTLKKFVTGKGTGPKGQMSLAVYRRWGVDTADDNQADAVGLAVFGAALQVPMALPINNLDAVRTFAKKHGIPLTNANDAA